MSVVFREILRLQYKPSMNEESPNKEFLWSVFSFTWTEYRDLLRKRTYSFWKWFSGIKNSERLETLFLEKLKEDIKLIKDSHKTMAFADKTSNMYRLTKKKVWPINNELYNIHL